MESVDLQRFVSGGYFLIRAGNPGWDQLRSELLPEMLISLSNCISPRLNIGWGWIPGDKAAALEFGVREALWDEFVLWSSRDYSVDIDIWSMFHSPDAARRIAKRFLGDFDNLHIIGIGLPQELEEATWREPNNGEEVYGVEKRIDQHLPLAAGGQPLGFEVVSYEYSNLAHSWLCASFHFNMYELFGIRPGQYGLMQTEQDARQVLEWMAEDDMKRQLAEPEPYDYWLLVDYPVEPPEVG